MIDDKIPPADKRKVIFKDRMTTENLQLLKVAHEFKNKFKFKYAWFKGNSVFLKKEDQGKSFRIRSELDFSEISEKYSV